MPHLEGSGTPVLYIGRTGLSFKKNLKKKKKGKKGERKKLLKLKCVL